MKNAIPAPEAIIKEAIIVIAGALLAAMVVSQLPGVKRYIKDSWQ